MLDACQADVRDSLVLDVTLKNFQHVSTRGGGSGPSFAERRVSKHGQEIEKGNRMGKVMFADEDTGLLIDPKSSHFPRPTKKRKKIYTTVIIYVYSSPSNKCNTCCFSFNGVERAIYQAVHNWLVSHQLPSLSSKGHQLPFLSVGRTNKCRIVK